MIGFASGNNEGSWIQVDNVRLFNEGTEATTTIPNFSFENWSDYTIHDPASWSSTNMELSEDGVANVTRSTDAVEGTYAARLENIQRSDYVMTGVMNYGGLPWSGTTSYDDKPEFLIGSYNYTPAEGDLGGIFCHFDDDVNTQNGILGNGYFYLGATNDYETFVLPISYWETNATSQVNLQINSGQEAGSVLLVDNFQFVNGYDVDITVKYDATPEPNLLEGATIDIETYKPREEDVPLTSDQNGEKSLKLPNGTYNITVTHPDYDEYSGTIIVDNAPTSKEIVMSVATGIKNTAEESMIVFPNPASELLSIQAWQQVKRIKILNMGGVVVLDKQTDKKQE
jgi:hypothetical protein